MNKFIKSAALSLGFDACGIAKAEKLVDDAEFLQSWLDKGMHGELSYLERNFEKRTDPRLLVPECKSVVVVLKNYYPEHIQHPNAPQIARYAFSEIDYHKVLKQQLQALEALICQQFGSEVVNADFQHSFVDSAPVLERRWAQRAGLGWLGKHTQLIHPHLGSYCFIAVLLLNAEMQYDEPLKARCGSCTRCMDACPTSAIENGTLDARKCISYLTIENKNEIPTQFHSKLSNCLVGCDICAQVCPWNIKNAKSSASSLLKPNTEWLSWTKEDWLQLTEEKFQSVFKKSAIKRAGYFKIRQTLVSLYSK